MPDTCTGFSFGTGEYAYRSYGKGTIRLESSQSELDQAPIDYARYCGFSTGSS